MRREAPSLGPAERAYASNYRTRQRAAGYLSKYDDQWTKRWNTRREIAIVRRFLGKAAELTGPIDDLLDLPSGPGRLLAAHGPVPRRLVFGDIGEGMVRLALENAPDVPGQVRVATLANGLELPFRDASFDGVLSVRLAHHLEGGARFEKYLREILRVSRGAVILTYFSSRSLKNRVRNVSVRLGRRGPKKSVDPETVRAIADRAGFDVEETVPLSRLGSGHHYVLLARRATKQKEFTRRIRSLASGSLNEGKPTVFLIERLPDRPYRMVAKRYPGAFSRGNLHRGGATRARIEREALLDLRVDGAPAARPVASWASEGRSGAGWIVTEEVAGARSLKEVAAGPDDPDLLPAVERLLAEMARLHARGWVLGDTFAKNILVVRGQGSGVRGEKGRAVDPSPLTPHPLSVWFIDQPRACRGSASRAVTRGQAGDLARLWKGIREAIPRDRLAGMLAGYLDARGGGEGNAAALAGRVETLARRLANETPLSSLVDAAKRKIRRLLR